MRIHCVCALNVYLSRTVGVTSGVLVNKAWKDVNNIISSENISFAERQGFSFDFFGNWRQFGIPIFSLSQNLIVSSGIVHVSKLSQLSCICCSSKFSLVKEFSN